MSTVSPKPGPLSTALTPDDRGQRRAALLRPLNTTLGVLSAVGLVIMVLRSSPPHAFALVGGSLLLNLGIDLLNRRGHTGFAAGLFTVWRMSATRSGESP